MTAVPAAGAARATLRLDRWLWFARLCKSRSLVQRLIARGQVSLNGAPVHKASAPVGCGDRLTIVIGATRRTLIVRDLGERRGPASEARALYEERGPPEHLDGGDAAPPLYRTGF